MISNKSVGAEISPDEMQDTSYEIKEETRRTRSGQRPSIPGLLEGKTTYQVSFAVYRVTP